MKNLYLIFLCLAFSGCAIKDKIIQEEGKSLILSAMTNGQWKVTYYDKGGIDVTNTFASYSFQFKSNYTVDAISNGTVHQTGTWNAAGNTQSQTISAVFQDAADSLNLLNGTWNINKTTWTSVDAKQTVGSELRTLRLAKQ